MPAAARRAAVVIAGRASRRRRPQPAAARRVAAQAAGRAPRRRWAPAGAARRAGLAAAAVLLGAAVTWLAVGPSTPAGAGIGPAGFARIAQQAITAANCRIYGGCANSPWRVTCTDHPSYQPLADRVTCRVTEVAP